MQIKNNPKLTNAKKKLDKWEQNANIDPLPKPSWLKVKLPNQSNITSMQNNFRSERLHTVCEEASCPNLLECFNHGTATFLIMGNICTRRCSFCDIEHGKPNPLDDDEPLTLAKTIAKMNLRYAVITSVDRDDLSDGGATHFSMCVSMIRKLNPNIKIEILVPDFKRRMDKALENLSRSLPDVFNHNIETIPRLYREIRSGADYNHSLNLLKTFKNQFPKIPTKSGLMLGLGETIDEVKKSLLDLRAHNVDMITIGQYLAPSKYHTKIKRYVTPQEFNELGLFCNDIGFTNIASAPLVRSSYHADLQYNNNYVD